VHRPAMRTGCVCIPGGTCTRAVHKTPRRGAPTESQFGYRDGGAAVVVATR
jgi:hypothetical protein